VLREPLTAAVAAAGFFSVGVIIALSIFLPLYFELVLGFTPTGSGVGLIVFLVAATVGSFIAGRTMVRTVHYKRVPLTGLAAGIAMLVVFAIKPAGLSLVEVSLLFAVGGTGLGVMYPVTTVMIQNAVPSHQLGTATGVLNFARQLGGAIIVAAFGTILLGGIGGGEGLTLDMLKGGAARTGADFAYLFRLVFAAGAIFLALGFIAVLAIEERPLRGRAEPVPAPQPQRQAAE